MNERQNNHCDKEKIEKRISEVKSLNDQENSIINNRITWMGVVQGLLVNVFYELIKKYIEVKSPLYLIMLTVISALGLILSFGFRDSLSLAHKALENLKSRYKELLGKLLEEPNAYKWQELPIAIGLFSNIENIKELDESPWGYSKFLKKIHFEPWKIIPYTFIALWVLLLLLTAYFWRLVA